MSVHAATHHLTWRVRIAYSWRDAAGGIYPKYEGYGCILGPQQVLTTYRVCQAALRKTDDPHRHAFVEIGQQRRVFRTFSGDEKLDLAVLKTDEPLLGREGKPIEMYPRFANDRPMPGQAIGLLTDEQLFGTIFFRGGDRRAGKFVCFSYGHVTLLKSAGELLYALAGIHAGDHCLGTALFDTDGGIVGVATDYLNHYGMNAEVQTLRASSAGYLVFSPTIAYTRRNDFATLLA